MHSARVPPGWRRGEQGQLVRAGEEQHAARARALRVSARGRYIVALGALSLCALTWIVVVAQELELARNDVGEAVPWQTRSILNDTPTWLVLGLDTAIVSALVAILVLPVRPGRLALVASALLAAFFFVVAFLFWFGSGFFSDVEEGAIVSFAAFLFVGCWSAGVGIGAAILQYR